MQIVLHRHIADQLRARYTVLDLEMFEVEGQVVEAFCVVSAEKLNLGELPQLEKNIKIHEEFITSLRKKDYQTCRRLKEDLYGKFGGELDSFYDEIMKRADSVQNN